MSFRIKRAYDEAAADDGYRVLIDRLWPRGLRKEALTIDAWAKELAPSTDLRKWFQHDPDRWDEFRRRYREELQEEPARSLLADLKRRGRRGTVTLVFGARDATHSNAEALLEMLREARSGARSASAGAGG